MASTIRAQIPRDASDLGGVETCPIDHLAVINGERGGVVAEAIEALLVDLEDLEP